MARIQYYKPNPKVSGSACSFWCNAKESAIFGSFIKQSSWNDKTKTGSFKANKEKPNASTQFKFNQTEAAAILDSIETNRPFSAYHSTSKQVTKFNFKPYLKDGHQVGFSYSVNKEDKEDSTNKANFIIGLTYPEARMLKQYLIYSLNSMFEQQDKESKEKYEDQAEQADTKLEPSAPASAPAPAPKPLEAKDILDDEEGW
jgi:hypothetical protein